MLLVCGRVTVSPDWTASETDTPAFTRLYRVYQGEILYTGAEGSQVLPAGRLYVLPSNAPYRISSRPVPPMNCFYLHLDLFPAENGQMNSLALDQDPLLACLLDTLERAWAENLTETMTAAAGTLETLLLERGILSAPDAALGGVLLYIADHYREPLMVAELSRFCGYSEAHFFRLFRQRMHMSPYQYLIRFRLKEAVHLLHGEDGLEEIAEKTGFLDAKSLCRQFTAHYGMPPGKFRRQIPRLP